MIFGFFKPQLNLSFDELDRISAKVPGKWTWPTAAMLWMIDHGFELRLVEDFDYEEFAKRGAEYIIDKCGKEVGEAQINNSLVERERDYARRFAKLNLVERRVPNFDDISRLLRDGYLLICNINAAVLVGNKGYSGHFVVIYECGDEIIRIHDPGLPPRPELAVPHSDFERAWAYPTENEKNLLAIRLK